MTPNGALFERVFRQTIAAYRRRWWHWYFDSSWQDMAFRDADHQANMVVRWAQRRKVCK